jgi:hypothetical protein
VAEEGRDEGRVRAQGFEAQALGVHGELPPTGFVGRPGERSREVAPAISLRAAVIARATLGEAEGGTSMTLGIIRVGGKRCMWC